MQLVTTYELAGRSDGELSQLFTMATEMLATSIAETAARRNALATLENIGHVRSAQRLES
jgi:hypothetical protein